MTYPIDDLPPFNDVGVMPVGDHPVSLAQLKRSHLVTGRYSSRPEKWDQRWRLILVQNLEKLVRQLWQAGVDEIYVAGSFVEDVGRPRDIDGYYVTDGTPERFTALQTRLNEIAGEPIWDLTPLQYGTNPKPERLMRRLYHIDLHPNWLPVFLANGQMLNRAVEYRHRKNSTVPRGLLKIVP